MKSLRMSEQVSGYPEAIDHFLTRQKRFEGMTNQIFEEASTYTNTHFLVM